MRKQIERMFIVLSVVLSLSVAAQAKEVYIEAIALKYKKDLVYIRSRLDDLRCNMYVIYNNRRYHVYTGGFESRKAAEKVLVRVQKYISKDAVIAGDLPIGKRRESQRDAESVTSFTVVVEEQEERYAFRALPEKEPIAGTWFMALSAGLSGVNVSQNDTIGAVVLDNQPDKWGRSYGLEGGYNISEHLFLTLDYGTTAYDHAVFHHLFSTFNYKFDTILKTSPYMGLLLGYSIMSWSINPIDSSYNDDRSSSYLGGLQMGLEIPLLWRVSLLFSYRLMGMEHSTQIKTPAAEATLKHTFEHTLNIGVRYRF